MSMSRLLLTLLSLWTTIRPDQAIRFALSLFIKLERSHIDLGKMWILHSTVGQRNYFTTSVTVLYELPLVAVLSIKGNNKIDLKNGLSNRRCRH